MPARLSLRRAVPTLLAAMLLTASAAGTARAQERQKYGKLRFGPLYLTPGLGVTAGVDNNVYNDPAGTADRALTVLPTLTAVLPLTRHARLRGTGGVAPYYFYKEASQRHTDVFGTAVAEVDVSLLTLYAGVGGGRYRERFSLEIDERLLRRESSSLFGATVRARKRVSLSASQRSVRSTFDPAASVEGEPVSTSLDRDTVTRRLEVRIPLTRKTTLLPFVEAVEDRFLHELDRAAPPVGSQRYGAALSFSELAFVNGSVAAGVRHFGGHDAVAPYDGLFLAADASMPFVLGTRLELVGSRDVNYSAIPTASASFVRSTYVNTLYRAQIFTDLPLKLQGRARVAYGEANYLVPTEEDLSLHRRDHAWTFGGTLLRRLGAHVSFGGAVDRTNRVSPVEGHTYQGVRYGVTGEVHF
jgi:hypothetical protein